MKTTIFRINRKTRLLIPVMFVVMLAASDDTCLTANAEQAASLDLAAALDEALTQGSRVDMAESRRAASEARSDWRVSAYVPEVDLSLSGSRSRYPRTLTSIREPGVFPELDRTVFDAVGSIRWTIWDFGRGRAERRALITQARVAAFSLDIDRMETIERVSEIFLRMSLLIEQHRVREDRVHQLRQNKSEIDALLEEGRAAAVDRLRITESIHEAEFHAQAVLDDMDHVRHQLAVELGRTEPPPLDEIAYPSLSRIAPAGPADSDELFVPAPHVALAEARREAALHALDAARRSRQPRVTAFGEHRVRTGSDFEEDQEWMAGVGLSVPIFQPRLSAESQAREAEAREATRGVEQACLALQAESERLLRLTAQAKEREGVAATRIHHLDELLRAESLMYAEGRLSLSDLLATQYRLESARIERLEAIATYRLLQVRHAVLAGTLTPGRAMTIIGEHP